MYRNIMISACVSLISSLSSSSLFLSQFMLTCSMMIFLSLLLLGLCFCVVFSPVVVIGMSVRQAGCIWFHQFLSDRASINISHLLKLLVLQMILEFILILLRLKSLIVCRLI